MGSSRKLALKIFTALALIIAGDVIPSRAQIIYWPLTAIELAKQKALSIGCLNNLKQIVYAARAWSLVHEGRFPGEILAVTNELSSPATLYCPANLSRQFSTNWADFRPEYIDYEWIPQANWNNVSDICCRCRIHENVVFVDGSTRQASGYRSGWPVVIAGPLRQDATPGSNIRLEVKITPDAVLPVTYQWRRARLSLVTNVVFVSNPDYPNGGYWTTNTKANFGITLLDGETNSRYVIANVQTNHSDYYSVVVSNAMGATASEQSRLLVDPSVSAMTTNNHWSAINCINNLHQIGTFARLWAADHNDRMPQSLSVMTNSFGLPIFGWPVVLFCRFDAARTAPADWSGVEFSETSYEVIPGDGEDFEAPFCRCKVHGFYVKMDGSVVSKPQFGGIRSLGNNTVELNFTLFAGQTNRLEVSTNLVTWMALHCWPSTNANFLFQDTNRSSQQFYRISTP